MPFIDYLAITIVIITLHISLATIIAGFRRPYYYNATWRRHILASIYASATPAAFIAATRDLIVSFDMPFSRAWNKPDARHFIHHYDSRADTQCHCYSIKAPFGLFHLQSLLLFICTDAPAFIYRPVAPRHQPDISLQQILISLLRDNILPLCSPHNISDYAIIIFICIASYFITAREYHACTPGTKFQGLWSLQCCQYWIWKFL
jgi:hypothetical protein